MSSQQTRLQADQLSVQIAGATILNKVSMHADSGEMIGLIGPNGAGKSTLLSLLAGLSTPGSGTVLLDGEDIASIESTIRARSIGWLPQMGEIHWPLSVHRLVSLGRYPHLSAWQKLNAEDEYAIKHALHVTDSTHLANRDATTLSGGERARVLMARVLAAKPSLLLADEPVSSLDLKHQIQTMDMLREFASGTQACIVVLHDLSLACRYCDRLYLINEGYVQAHGNAATVLSNENIKAVYGVEVITGCDTIPWIVPHKLANDQANIEAIKKAD